MCAYLIISMCVECFLDGSKTHSGWNANLHQTIEKEMGVGSKWILLIGVSKNRKETFFLACSLRGCIGGRTGDRVTMSSFVLLILCGPCALGNLQRSQVIPFPAPRATGAALEALVLLGLLLGFG